LTGEADTVAYCHCTDCKRWTGSPLPAFAAFSEDKVQLKPEQNGISFFEGVTRWVCPACGSPMMAAFEYLPGQIYVPLGILSDPSNFVPQIHCHQDTQLPWLKLHDELEKISGSARDELLKSSAS
jgi:hypothetical protein